ncbi:hypothetical protein Ga0100231_000715 [Opitutaceae bacterium TAV4]|nr:hypothetical protein Ga0100230_012035 [Opitutaceae bacterium TAV3]RRK01370.1 hypothetical protein Ga0100231_000715 [Opitutaceae bacterium TAV4]
MRHIHTKPCIAMKTTITRSVATLAALLALSTLPAAAATIIADFTGGAGTTNASHQFEGKSGEGWKTAWSTASTNTTLTTALVADDYLKVSVAVAGDSTPRRSSLNRAYNSGSTATIDTTATYTLTFDLRFDDLTGFSTKDDYIGIFDSPTRQTSVAVGGVANSWAFQITGNSKTIQWNSGSKDGGVANFVSSGVIVETGKLYTFTVTVNPTDHSYIASIVTDGAPASTVTSSALGFRSAAADLGDAGRYFHINTLMDGTTDSWSYAFSGLTISQTSIPEPAITTVWLAGAITILAAAFRRRRR